MDAKLHKLLLNLRGALSRALAQSAEAHQAVREIHREGWSLYLVVDPSEDSESAAALELTRQRKSPQPPVFKIDGSDLSFLRSIGIDPTRKLKRRR